MKRILYASLSASLCAGLAACSGGAKTTGTATPAIDPAAAADTQASGTGADVAPEPPSPREQFFAECTQGTARARQLLDTLVDSSGDRTVENTVVPYDEMFMYNENSMSRGQLARSVYPDAELREAGGECEAEADKFASELALNRAVYDAFVALDTTGLDPVTVRLVENTRRDFRINGVDKDEQTRARIKQIDQKMSEVGQQFDKNIPSDTRYVYAAKEDLGGLPADWIAQHEVNAEGKLKISTDNPDFVPVQTYADNLELRRQLYIERKARAGETNTALLGQILELRAEKARLLGFANYADYVTSDKMMKSGDAAAAFIERVATSAKKRAAKDYKQLLKRKRKDKAYRGAKEVADYEKSYYEEKVKAEDYKVDSQLTRQYFEYSAVEQGLLSITSEIYGIEYVRVDPAEAAAWHPSVKTFDVMRDGTKIGRIHLDMHPRENKYKHYAMFTINMGVAGKQLPEGALVCNFPNPAASSEPAFMEHSDVVTMFHEFGHLMHNIFGGHGPYARYAGTLVERDFVEAPSQMFEQWAWGYESLSRFAKHYETGEVIPEALVAKMQRADKFGVGLTVSQQMFYAALSLELHRVDATGLDIGAKVRELQAKYTPFAFVEGTAMHASFGHLNGYSATYYTYMWSKVLAKDILSPFKKHGLLNTEWTHKYRDKLLAPGGTKDAVDMLKDFLGRPYNYKAFEKWLRS